VNIGGGSLIVNAQMDGLGAVLAQAGTLGGLGSINLPVGVAATGTLAPGDPDQNGGLGTLGVGNLTSSGTLLAQLKDSTAGDFDQLLVTGTVDLSGTFLSLSIEAGFSANPGDIFALVLNDGADAVTGTFSQGGTVTVGANQFNITYDANLDGGTVGNDVALTYVVPEPGALAILLGGFGTLVGLRRRRRGS
jgi:hypothetical protein